MTELITTPELDSIWVDICSAASTLMPWTYVLNPDARPHALLIRPIVTRFPDIVDPDPERRDQFRELLHEVMEVIASITATLDQHPWAHHLWTELSAACEDLRDLIVDDRSVPRDDACLDPRSHLTYVSWGMVVPPILTPTWRQLTENHSPEEAFELLFKPST